MVNYGSCSHICSDRDLADPYKVAARVSSPVSDFNARNKILTAELLQLGYRYHNLQKAFSKFYRRHYEFVSKFKVGLKPLFNRPIGIRI